jgi:hypothetical protein
MDKSFYCGFSKEGMGQAAEDSLGLSSLNDFSGL